VEEIRRRLEDPELYATEEGAREAAVLGKSLEVARSELDRALEEWEAAM
jgi:hypothetical protein